MPTTSHACRATVTAALAGGLALAPSAVAHEPQRGGAAVAPKRPEISRLKCDTGERRRCPRGEFLALRGERLDTVETVVFLGRRGRADNRRTEPRRRSEHRTLVEVPEDARTGKLRVVSDVAGRSRPSRPLRVVAAGPAPPPAAASDVVFPVRGDYDFGGEASRFGGGRGHKGQDIFADCGTPIVAARAGEVTDATYQAQAGNYAVVTADDGTSQAYMHMLGRAEVRRGDRVAAGDAIGEVGESGNAQGCHLHFELWTAPGWYRGGEAMDPLPELERWAASGDGDGPLLTPAEAR